MKRPPAPPLDASEFRDITGVSPDVLGRLEMYLAALRRWQKTVNLVGARSLADPWRRHMLDSAQLAAQLPPEARFLADIGSGAGFPGLVLAIMLGGDGPEIHLVESNARKCAFLREVNRKTGAGAVVHDSRVEKLRDFSADVVTARGVARLEKLLNLAYPLLKKGGQCLFLKGRKWREELTEAEKNWIMIESHIRSLSDPSGMILKLEALRRRDRP